MPHELWWDNEAGVGVKVCPGRNDVARYRLFARRCPWIQGRRAPISAAIGSVNRPRPATGTATAASEDRVADPTISEVKDNAWEYIDALSDSQQAPDSSH